LSEKTCVIVCMKESREQGKEGLNAFSFSWSLMLISLRRYKDIIRNSQPSKSEIDLELAASEKAR